jgi:hypothetical protein
MPALTTEEAICYAEAQYLLSLAELRYAQGNIREARSIAVRLLLCVWHGRTLD